MLNKKLSLSLVLVLVISFSFLLTAGAETENDQFRVAMVMPSTVNDMAWSQSMYDSLTAVQEEMGKEKLEIAYSENKYVISEARTAIRDYAKQGFDLVIAHGSQYGAELVNIAPDFPETSFAWGSTARTFSDQGIDNIFAYEPHAQQGGYVNGVLAAKLSESDVMGFIGPVESGDAKKYLAGLKQGVLAKEPEADVKVTWTGSYSDVAAAAKTAKAHIQAGADVLTGTSQMVTGAIGEAEKNDVMWFGYDVDQSPLAPKVVVSSVVVDFTDAVKQMINLVKEGTLGGKIFPATLENGGLKIPINKKALGEEEYEEVNTLAEETINKIIEGEIEIQLED